MPNLKLFNDVIGTVMSKMESRFPFIRAYGEMVDILLENGNVEGVIELENYWNLLARKNKFSLLCAYLGSRFDSQEKGSVFDKVCSTHSHCLSTETVMT